MFERRSNESLYIRSGVGAVSYTHLDVYKRQAIGSPDTQYLTLGLAGQTEALPVGLPATRVVVRARIKFALTLK